MANAFPFKVQVLFNSTWIGILFRYKKIYHMLWHFSRGFYVISWKSKKQKTISRSFVEVEYRTVVATTSELVWHTQLILDLHISNFALALIFCENTSTIHIANNPVFYERTKHIELDCHFIHDHILKSNVKPMPIHMHMQLAILFTKPLPLSPSEVLLSKMEIIIFLSPILRGSIKVVMNN